MTDDIEHSDPNWKVTLALRYTRFSHSVIPWARSVLQCLFPLAPSAPTSVADPHLLPFQEVGYCTTPDTPALQTAYVLSQRRVWPWLYKIFACHLGHGGTPVPDKPAPPHHTAILHNVSVAPHVNTPAVISQRTTVIQWLLQLARHRRSVMSLQRYLAQASQHTTLSQRDDLQTAPASKIPASHRNLWPTQQPLCGDHTRYSSAPHPTGV